MLITTIKFSLSFHNRFIGWKIWLIPCSCMAILNYGRCLLPLAFTQAPLQQNLRQIASQFHSIHTNLARLARLFQGPSSLFLTTTTCSMDKLYIYIYMMVRKLINVLFCFFPHIVSTFSLLADILKAWGYRILSRRTGTTFGLLVSCSSSSSTSVISFLYKGVTLPSLSLLSLLHFPSFFCQLHFSST